MFSYEKITTPAGVHWRVRDMADNRVATCYQEANAMMVVMALNKRALVQWTCGHTAQGQCGECFQALLEKAAELQQKYDLAIGQLADQAMDPRDAV